MLSSDMFSVKTPAALESQIDNLVCDVQNDQIWSQNVLNLIWKIPGFVPIWGQSDPPRGQIR